jgi:hypothetical protein
LVITIWLIRGSWSLPSAGRLVEFLLGQFIGGLGLGVDVDHEATLLVAIP